MLFRKIGLARRILGKNMVLRLASSQLMLTVGFYTGNKYARFIRLPKAARRAFNRGKLSKADRLARELLDLAGRYQEDWNQGNAIHFGNMIRGLCALRAGRLSAAEEYLLASARCPASPQLSTFGPSMRLAAELLRSDAREAVLQYLEDCKALWQFELESPDGQSLAGPVQLENWATEIRLGQQPDFGPNLLY